MEKLKCSMYLFFYKKSCISLMYFKFVFSFFLSNFRLSSAVPQFSLMMSSPARRSSCTALGSQQSNNSRSDFASALKKWSAPIPPVLSRKLGRVSDSPLGKVRVTFSLSQTDVRKNQFTFLPIQSTICQTRRRIVVKLP